MDEIAKSTRPATNSIRSFAGSSLIGCVIGALLTSTPAFPQATKAPAALQQKSPPHPDAAATKQERAAAANDTARTVRALPLTAAARTDEAEITRLTPTFLPFLRAELLLVRSTLNLTEAQTKAIGREVAQAVRTTSANFVEWRQSAARRARFSERPALPDFRRQLQDSLAAVVNKCLTAEQQARYQTEIETRNAEAKRHFVDHIVAVLDRELLLSAGQRARLSQSLSAHWDYSWCEVSEEMRSDTSVVPRIPDEIVVPLLDAVQTQTWEHSAKRQAGLRNSPFGWDIVVDGDPLKDVELEPAQQAELKKLQERRAEAERQIAERRKAMLAQIQAVQAMERARVLAARKNAQARELARRQAGVRAVNEELVEGASRLDEPEEEDRQVAPQAVAMVRRREAVAQLFGNFRMSEARRRFDAVLALRIGDVDRAVGLTEQEKEKLRVAGRGDIKRFFDEMDETLERASSINDNRARAQELSVKAQALRQALGADPFGDQSLFARVLCKTLEEGRLVQYRRALSDRRSFQTEAAFSAVVATLGNDLGLSSQQQSQLVDRLLKKTRPLKRFGRNDYWFVLHQAAHLPEEELRALFGETQWAMFYSRLLTASRMGPSLKENGYEFDDEPAAAEPAPEKGDKSN
jgi:hypothetical protein